MAADDVMELYSGSESATRAFGRRVGESLPGPVTLGLCGELGAGKTVFVRGLCAGLGVPGDVRVTSPAFQLVNVYPGGRFPVVHADAYRLPGPAAFEELGVFEAAPGAVVVVEWADKVRAALPDDLFVLEFIHSGETARTIRYPSDLPGGV